MFAWRRSCRSPTLCVLSNSASYYGSILMDAGRVQFLKLESGNDIHKVTNLPDSFLALQRLLHTTYARSDFTIRYKDEENDLITISSDSDLQTAYATTRVPTLRLFLEPKAPSTPIAAPQNAASKPTAKGTQPHPPCILHSLGQGIVKLWNRNKPAPPAPSTSGLTPSAATPQKDQFIQRLAMHEIWRLMGMPVTPTHERVKCDGCGLAPIIGARYKCTQCTDFDFCELCEADTEHAHPFLKITQPVTGPDYRSSSASARYQGDSKPKADIVAKHWDAEDPVSPSERLLRSWTLRNTGSEAWPSGSRLVFQRGEVFGETAEVQSPQPTAEVVVGVTVAAPANEGRYRGVFALVTPRGEVFGPELAVEMTVVKGYQSR